MPFDYKKEYKEYYMPKNQPSIVTVPPVGVRMPAMRFSSVDFPQPEAPSRA